MEKKRLSAKLILQDYSKAKTLRAITINDTSKPCKNFADIAKQIASSIPDEELAKLPSDASSNLDHYLYGSTK